MSTDRHLLIVDDDPDIRQLLGECLSHAGYREAVPEMGEKCSSNWTPMSWTWWYWM